MTSVQRPDEWLSDLTLPLLEGGDSCQASAGDVIVLCAGFEERSIAYLRRLVETGSRGFDVLAVDYLPKEVANQQEEVAQLAVKANAPLRWLTYDRENSTDVGECVEGLRSAKRIVVDISGMSRLLVVQLVTALIRRRLAHRSEVVYAEALEYPPSREEVEAALASPDDLFGVINFISAGAFGILVPPELSTVAMYGQPIRLIVFPSFNPSQFAALRSEISAASYTVVHGIPPRPENQWRTEAIRRLNRIDAMREVEQFSASTLDYRETVRLILDVYRRHGEQEKLVIAPVGSKMQAVAVGVVAGFLQDLQIVYPAPRSFPAPRDYTHGVRSFYSLRLSAFEWGQPIEADGSV